MTERDRLEPDGPPARGEAAGAEASPPGVDPVDPRAPVDVEGTGPAVPLRQRQGTPRAGADEAALEGPDALARRAAAGASPRSVSAGAIVLSALLPGAGHALAGARARGLAVLIPWVAVLATLLLVRDRLAALPDEGSLDDWVALGATLVTLAALWGWAMLDLLRVRSRARAAAEGTPEAERGVSQWTIAAVHFRRDRLAVAGLAIVVLLYLVAILAPLIAPYDPIAQRDLVATSYLPPSPEHLLGTDLFGRDILSRILYGARISLAVAFIAVAIAVALGTLLGAVAGYFGGWVDAVVMRFTDMVLAFPRLVLLILIVALFPPSLLLIILVLGLTQWPGTARIVRGEVLSLREREFVQAARALGMRQGRIILRHIVPNVLAPVIVAATLGIGNTIVLEAGLSFLGIGVQAPTPSWGNMVADGRNNLLGAWWVATFPGLTIVLTVLAFNLAGDGLRDALDPRLRE